LGQTGSGAEGSGVGTQKGWRVSEDPVVISVIPLIRDIIDSARKIAHTTFHLNNSLKKTSFVNNICPQQLNN